MYVCRKMRLCTYLLSKGFNYVKTEPMKDNPELKVWLFESTPELWLAVHEYYEQLNDKLSMETNEE